MEKNPKLVQEDTCAVILAAGLSSRMGRFKPLLEIDGKSAVKHLIGANKNAGIDSIVVVTGYRRDELESSIEDEDVTVACNMDYERGMFTSVQAGLRKAMELKKFRAFLLFLTDVPLISSRVIMNLLSACKYDDHFVVPCYEGKKGHPLLIPAKYADEIISHDGTNGLKGVTNRYDDKFVRMETEDESVVLDMDVPCDYDEILTYYDKSKSPAPKKNILNETSFEGRLCLVRHGSTRLHKEKIFMGQCDVPLSDKGRREVAETADALVRLRLQTCVIYTSPLLRAMESAEIIRDRFLACEDTKTIVEASGLMEVNLGDWDGKFISEIRAKYPAEYEKRGQNLLIYKRPPDGENYYDLKYRVLKELKKILKAAAVGEDIIMVTHKGVINAIRESILGLDSHEACLYNPPKGSVTVIDTKHR